MNQQHQGPYVACDFRDFSAQGIRHAIIDGGTRAVVAFAEDHYPDLCLMSHNRERIAAFLDGRQGDLVISVAYFDEGSPEVTAMARATGSRIARAAFYRAERYDTSVGGPVRT